MQICVARMLKESGFFFCVRMTTSAPCMMLISGVKLLALLGVGFLQGLYALDAADGQTDHPVKVSLLMRNS